MKLAGGQEAGFTQPLREKFVHTVALIVSKFHNDPMKKNMKQTDNFDLSP